MYWQDASTSRTLCSARFSSDAVVLRNPEKVQGVAVQRTEWMLLDEAAERGAFARVVPMRVNEPKSVSPRVRSERSHSGSQRK